MLLHLLTLASGAAFAAAEVLSLSQLNWTLQNVEGQIKVSAQQPSQVHLDLTKANVITEPLLGINDFSERWIVTDSWVYQADLSLIIAQRSQDNSSSKNLLVFYGLDTIANITVAGHPLAWVNNQFQQYVYDVTDYLASPADNDTTLTIAFESPITYGQNVSARADFEWTGVRQFIRKIGSDFGWDWAPGFAPSGVFKPAYLVTLSDAADGTAADNNPVSHPLLVSQSNGLFIEESTLEITKVGQNPNVRPDESADWLVNVTLAIRSIRADPNPTIIVSIPELNVNSGPLKLSAIPAATDTSTFVSAAFTVPEGLPQRWYPHTVGTPKLYNITMMLNVAGLPAASYTTRSGFRTTFLVQTPYSQEDVEQRGITPGDQWHFEVNGKTIYSKGSNLTPLDVFYPRITTDKVRWILESVVKGGQNMLRAWGGGIYQPSDELTGGYDFYSLCDELGILVWSELGFSDSTYPVNDFFLDSVEREVRQNVRRIKKHPSNVQWAGSNEIEVIIRLLNSSTVPVDLGSFLHIFQNFLHDIVLEEQSSVPYTACSTTNGVLSLEPYILRLDNVVPGNIYGNTELYNYDPSQAFNYSTYPVARFVNEFGFPSMPSFYSWEEVLESPDDFSFNSTVVMSRDHHPPATSLTFPNPRAPEGQKEMTVAVELWLPTPGTSDSNQTFAQWCWSTQVFQTLYMQSEIAFYRRGSGRGENNLGATVWQLNDIWQGVSWSAIEYSGRWKVLQYGLENIYTPVIVYPFWVPETESLEVSVTSDLWETVDGTVQFTWYDWLGNSLHTSSHAFAVPSLNSTVVYTAQGLDNILPSGSKAEDVWMLLSLTARVNGETVTHEQHFVPTSLANANLVDPQIKVTSSDDLTFMLSAHGGVAPFTWLDHPSGTVGYFEDTTSNKPLNGFYLVPGSDRTGESECLWYSVVYSDRSYPFAVRFVQSAALSTVAHPSPSDFVVRSLWNNTHL
ncbi:glycoside hydrolase [Trametes versicolor FP-101664 SS1]|uniref:glycoside hydrolase n=1 Tax=Trametes versicolor (strain FP-101664) TaxID=717944 RepID=UPI0004622E39|nr:glycoside hydrolase [Trametes versicolor FP-101664 SS1]EIW64193.1 glycoside hydrolase [Trametes versicolor FP-101664 SS1]